MSSDRQGDGGSGCTSTASDGCLEKAAARESVADLPVRQEATRDAGERWQSDIHPESTEARDGCLGQRQAARGTGGARSSDGRADTGAEAGAHLGDLFLIR